MADVGARTGEGAARPGFSLMRLSAGARLALSAAALAAIWLAVAWAEW